jgi:hypothetical protein
VLDEVAVDQRVDIANHALGIDLDARRKGGRLAAQDVGRRACHRQHAQCEVAS